MNFNFEVNNMILRQKKSQTKLPDDLNNLFCSFTFTTPEWKHLEKYVIFWNRKGKSTIRYLGKGSKERCPLPEMVLNDLHFIIQVYANDDVYTQKLKVFTHQDVEISHHHNKNKQEIYDFFKKMENKIDNIVYDEGKFLIYANNTLIKSIDVVDEGLVSRILTNIAPQLVVDTAISEDSDLPVSSRLVYEALQEKVSLSDLSIVAQTGSYNDLTDIPTEFNPAPHTHLKEDIEDFDESVDEDFDDFIDELILKL